jgi:iron complex outermembrane recepter protein
MRMLLLTLPISTLVLAAPAWAQDPASVESEVSETDQIFVTAQRRSERLVDVPISITALSGNALEQAGVRSTEDLTAVVAGLNFATNGAFAQPTIRGIGTTVTAAGNDANVAIYVDDVYQPNQVGNFAELVDLEQVEVLKGPQGTLFGRNATGGAIRVTTKRPSFTPELRMTASYGSFQDVRLTAFATAPLSDRLAVSLSFLYADDDGYVQNLGTGNRVADSNALSLRGKILFEATDRVEFMLTASRNERVSNPAFTLGVLNGNSNAVNLPGSIRATNPREVSLSFDPIIDVVSDQISFHAKADLGFAELSSVTSYANIVTDLVTDIDRTNLPLVSAAVPGEQETWTQEINLVSQGDSNFKWFAGLFYYNDDATSAVIINNGAIFNTIRQKTEAIAPFGEVNLTLGKLTLLAGARYNIEKKDYSITRGPAEQLREITFNTFTPRIGLRYATSDYSSVYATFSKGFKAGGFDGILAGGALVVNPVFPENVDAYEAGFKFGKGRTSLSIAGFYYDYSNIQFQAFNPNAGGLTQVFNAAAAEIYGGEIEGSAELFDGFNVRGSVAYTRSQYNDFPGATLFCPRGAPSFGNAVVALGANNPCTGQPNTRGAGGNELIRTPEFTASISPTYQHRFADGSAFDASATAFYSGRFFWDPGNRLEQAAYVLINAELGYTFPGNQFKLAVWGRNLADELYSLYVTEAAAGDSIAYARPRTFGVRGELRF